MAAAANNKYNNSIQDFFDNYYLCHETRHRTSLNIIRPFGSLNEVKQLYTKRKNNNIIKLNKIRNNSYKQKNVRIVGPSQFGLYFRFVNKKDIDTQKLYKNNKTNIVPFRSYVFDIKKLLMYIMNEYKNYSYFEPIIPLAWYTPGNFYGYEQKSLSLLKPHLTNKKAIEQFIRDIKLNIHENIYDHEFVTRIPIPLTNEAGIIGRINFGILSLGR